MKEDKSIIQTQELVLPLPEWIDISIEMIKTFLPVTNIQVREKAWIEIYKGYGFENIDKWTREDVLPVIETIYSLMSDIINTETDRFHVIGVNAKEIIKDPHTLLESALENETKFNYYNNVYLDMFESAQITVIDPRYNKNYQHVGIPIKHLTEEEVLYPANRFLSLGLSGWSKLSLLLNRDWNIAGRYEGESVPSLHRYFSLRHNKEVYYYRDNLKVNGFYNFSNTRSYEAASNL